MRLSDSAPRKSIGREVGDGFLATRAMALCRKYRGARGVSRWTSLVSLCAIAFGVFGGRAVYRYFSSTPRERGPLSEPREQQAFRERLRHVDEVLKEEKMPTLRPRVDKAFKEIMRPIQDDPMFTGWAKAELLRAVSGAPSQQGTTNSVVAADGFVGLGAQLAAQGAARLSADELLEMIRLKLKLAGQSDKVCAAFWSGGLSFRTFRGT